MSGDNVRTNSTSDMEVLFGPRRRHGADHSNLVLSKQIFSSSPLEDACTAESALGVPLVCTTSVARETSISNCITAAISCSAPLLVALRQRQDPNQRIAWKLVNALHTQVAHAICLHGKPSDTGITRPPGSASIVRANLPIEMM